MRCAATTEKRRTVPKTTDAKIMTNLSNVDEAIKLYKSNKKIEKVTNEENEEIVTDEDLIEDKVLNEYVVEETLRPIAIVTSDKLGISNSFGGGYKEISSYSIQDIKAQCIATLKELNNVCAIDLTDGNLYYLKDGQVWSISGNKDIMKTYERVNADINEWTFDTNTKTLTAYNYKDKLKEQRGEQEPGKVIIPNYYNGVRVSGIGSTFANNTDITTLTISNGIHIIKALAFQECKNLKGNIVIPKTVTTIGERAFLNCSSLEGLTIEEGCTASLPDGWCSLGVFQGCKALRGTITIPSTFGNLGTNAFGGCSGIEKIIIKNSELNIYDGQGTIDPKTIIIGYSNSTAQAYATKYNRIFELIQ